MIMKVKSLLLVTLLLCLPSTGRAWNGDTWGSITRSSIKSIADQMIDSTWAPNNTFYNYEYTEGGVAVRYTYTKGVTYTGIPYGQTNPQDNWQEFAGYMPITGSGNKGYGNDCSGFVSICWKLPQRNTTATFESGINGPYWSSLGNIGSAASVSLLQGDAINSSSLGHIIMFLNYESSGIRSMEQTPHHAQRKLWSYSSLSAYRPIRRTQIVGDGQPDLTIVEPLTVSPVSVTPGGSIQVGWTEKNKGTADATLAHSTKIYLSSTPYGTTYMIAYYGPMTTLAANASKTYSEIIDIPTTVPTGNYYVTAFIDCNQEVAEAIENNNIGGSSPNTVSIGYSLPLINSVRISPPSGSGKVVGSTLGVEVWVNLTPITTGFLQATITGGGLSQPITAGVSVPYTAIGDRVVDLSITSSLVQTANYTIKVQYRPGASGLFQGDQNGDATSTVYYSVRWTPDHYTLDISAGSGGSVDPSGVISKGPGEDQTFVARPILNSNYVVDQWLLDGIPVANLNGSTTYTLSDIIANHTVQVTFKAVVVTYAVTPSAGPNGNVSPNTAQIVNSGAGVSFNGSPNANYIVSQWLVDGVVVQNGGIGYTLSNIQDNHSVQVTFKAVSHLGVSPSDGLASSGNQGGPFSQSSKTYSVSNVGGGTLDWTAISDKNWITATPTTGQNSGNVVVSINDNAKSLIGSSGGTIYTAAVTFSGGGDTTIRNVQLTVFTKPSSPIFDLNGDGYADILLQHRECELGIWMMTNTNGAYAALQPQFVQADWSMVGAGDLYGDGKREIVFQHRDGSVAAWIMSGTVGSYVPLNTDVPQDANWRLRGVGDINKDGKADLIWQNTDGRVGVCFVNQNVWKFGSLKPDRVFDTNWKIVGAGDIDGDGKAEILWQHSQGALGFWTMNGVEGCFVPLTLEKFNTSWRIVGGGDINGDGKAEIVAQHSDGSLASWVVTNGQGIYKALNPTRILDPNWQMVAVGDVTGDQKAEILWQHNRTELQAWFMNGSVQKARVSMNPAAINGTTWQMVGAGDIDANGKYEIIWQHDDGYLGVWSMIGTNGTFKELNPSRVNDKQWRIVATSNMARDGKAEIVWQHEDGDILAWFMNGLNGFYQYLTPFNAGDPLWRIVGSGDFEGKGNSQILWRHQNGTLIAWDMNGVIRVQWRYLSPSNPGSQWRVAATADYNNDGITDIIWQNEQTGEVGIWTMKNLQGTWQALSPTRYLAPGWEIVGPK